MSELIVELCAVPVIVAGEAWYRRKGFTLDPANREEYFALLDRVLDLTMMSSDEIALARRYAYHFIFRRMIPFPSLRYSPGVQIVRSLDDLLPGKYFNIDTVCEAILTGKPFLSPTGSVRGS